MDKQKEALKIAADLLEDIELHRLNAPEVVLKATRVARLTNQDELLEFLDLERSGYASDPVNWYWVKRTGRESKDKEGHYYPHSVIEVEAQLESARSSIQALSSGGNYSGDYIAIAAREHDDRIAAQARFAAILSTISGQVVSIVYDMVLDIYHELLFSQLQASLFSETQTKVDGLLSAASGTALAKIDSISDRLREGHTESVSQAMTACRRLIDSCADALFPGQAEPYLMGETQLSVTNQNVLNRLQAYMHSLGIPSGRRDRLRKTLKELYSRSSAGTHADISIDEARFVFLQTYVVLGEVLTLPTPIVQSSLSQD